MTVIPLQFFGIGDIIFTMTLVKRIANGNPILWPVMPQFVEGLNRAYPDVRFVDYRTIPVDYECREHKVVTLAFDNRVSEYTLLPIRWADSILKVPYSDCMWAKYDLYNMDYREWKEDAMWERDIPFQTALPTNFDIDVFSGDPYTIINRTFGSDSQLRADIKAVGIEMKPFENFSLFDWALTLENATEIHTVSTSIIYLLEQLDLKAKEVHLYPRKPIEQDFRNVDYLLTRHKYILHG